MKRIVIVWSFIFLVALCCMNTQVLAGWPYGKAVIGGSPCAQALEKRLAKMEARIKHLESLVIRQTDPVRSPHDHP